MSDFGFTVEELAARTDRAPWLVARSLIKLLEAGLLKADGGTSEQAIEGLRKDYLSKDTPDA